ncbi:unnamed protein product [Clonostachys rhizophaga]|uniref:Uncharacterized protein n=1 Tax=Clonostachys rhizophaga TaxID=160324 RepID=A0A9N9YKX2_9HYPO|nr:unnamed protein product [Clonostachys rhizophaga]
MSYNEIERSVESINGKIDDHWYVYQETHNTLAHMDDMDSDAALHAMEKMRRLADQNAAHRLVRAEFDFHFGLPDPENEGELNDDFYWRL